jgi:hypothetical protein
MERLPVTATQFVQAAGLLLLTLLLDQIVPGVLLLATVAGTAGLLVAAAGKRVQR